ncbi:type VI secretion system lipoprotein TssJ [Methylomicrobium lacus]|uniref:type VI secretion system lipoprotein TssJ n=1 Tax=Methylomicrobium lacus TaxID=136992 RepID=UPI0035A8D2FE
MIRAGFVSMGVLALLQACSSPPPAPPVAAPEPPTIVNLKISSAANVNADASGAGAPVMLRIYQLRETSSFNAADFFSLFDKDQATLSAEMARKQELLIKPNDQQTVSLQLDPDIKTLGVFAAFRQLDTAQWRATLPVAAHQTQAVEIKLQGNEVRVEAVKKEP